MRVLVVHNRYRSDMPSGENRVVDDEVDMLREAGVEVQTFLRDSDDIAEMPPVRKLLLGASPIHSRGAAKDFEDHLHRFTPDVVHVHNVFPLISPTVVRVAKAHGIPVVQTVHNYRHNCPAGTHLRNGAICEDCTGKRMPWPSVVHGCYRESRLQSASMAGAAWVHRPTWIQVDRFFAVSSLVAEKLTAVGAPADRIVVKPNAVDGPESVTEPGSGVLFAGRLGDEKGIRQLLAAWPSVVGEVCSDLTIVGDGPLRRVVETAASELPTVRYLGSQTPTMVASLLEECGVVCVPSICFEGLPTNALEAFAHGRPVVTTSLGALAAESFRSAVWTCEPEPKSLARSLAAALTDPKEIRRRGEAGRVLWEDRFTRQRVSDRLIAEYTDLAIGRSSSPSSIGDGRSASPSDGQPRLPASGDG